MIKTLTWSSKKVFELYRSAKGWSYEVISDLRAGGIIEKNKFVTSFEVSVALRIKA